VPIYKTFYPVVPKVGFEPTWGYPHPLLRRARLPFRHFGLYLYFYAFKSIATGNDVASQPVEWTSSRP
jgi:murein L,D-transpeptidase YcbB/YkuD